MKQLRVVKIGGNVIDNPKQLEKFLFDFSTLKGPKILVHGGGKIASQMAKGLGVETKLVDGRRITDENTIDIVTMVYAGLVNKKVVAKLQAISCNALGLSGPDGNALRAVKRPVKDIDYGFVGDLQVGAVNVHLLEKLLDEGIVPVFSAITHDGNGQLLNTNADTIASALATALARDYTSSLVYCFEKKGVLKDVDDEDSILREIQSSEMDGLVAKGIVSGGMIPKVHNAFEAIQNGVKEVYIGSSDELSLLEKQNFGTRLIE